MFDQLDTLMAIAWSHFWQVTIVILVVAAIVRIACRKRPHLAYLLWMLVIVKCLTPPLWSSPTGVFSWLQAESSSIVEVAESSIELEEPISEEPIDQGTVSSIEIAARSTRREAEMVPARSPNVPDALASDPGPMSAPPVTPGQPRLQLSMSAIVFGTWASGLAICLLVVAVKHMLCTRAINNSSRDADPKLQTQLQQLAKRLGISRSVRLLVSTSPIGPAVFGLFRPTILLPDVLLRHESTSTNSSARVESILAHELVHVRRGDTLFGVLQMASQMIWWFHPLVWWASRELTRERERCCDEEAVAGLACDPSEYAQTLLDVLKSKRELKPLFAQPGVRSVDITARRLQHIMQVDREFRDKTPISAWSVGLIIALLVLPGGALVFELGAAGTDELPGLVSKDNSPVDWPQYGGGPLRNNVSRAQGLPTTWDLKAGNNVKWTAKLGTSVYSSPVLASGKVLIGTNNGAGYGQRVPASKDASCLVCFDAESGEFLWQHVNAKLATGRVHDWPLIGICSTSLVEDDRVWYVNNRNEVVCLDLEGFYDNENDGPVRDESANALGEADVVWKFDMMKELGVSQHNQAICSITSVDDVLLVSTSNGVDHSHIAQPPASPNFIAVNKVTGKLIWQDDSATGNLLHGQWSSPAYGVIGGVGQAIFAGGDGWLYSFDVAAIKRGKSELLWKFDCNPKASVWKLGGQGTRNNAIAIPVVHNDRVYFAVGQDPEHGEGDGHVWCIDATHRGDISPEIVFNESDPTNPIAHKRAQAAVAEDGDIVKPNPNSGVVWHFDKFDLNGDGEITIEETMHRSFSSVVVNQGLAIIPDYSGFIHCLDATTGVPLWSYDMYATVWGTPLVADNKIYIGDEDGDVAVFELSRELTVLAEANVDNSVYTTIMAAGRTLFVPSQGRLYAFESPAPKPTETKISASKLQESSDSRKHAGRWPFAAPKALKALWTFRTNTEFEAAPVIADGVAYVGDLVDSLYAIDVTTGRPKWKLDNGVGFAATPLIVDQRLYVGDLDGTMHCVDTRVGKTIWKHNAGAAITGSANAVDGYVVFGAEDGSIFACDPKTGRLAWKTTVTTQLQSAPAVAGNRVIIAGCDQQMHVLDVASGQKVLSTDLASPTGATPVVRNGNVFVGTEDGVLFCIDLATGKVRWRCEDQDLRNGVRGSVAVTDDIVVVAGRSKTLLAVDAGNGKVLWKFAAKARFDSSPVIVNGHVLLGSSDGRLYVLQLDSGKTKLVYETGSAVTGSVAVSNGQIVLATDDGKVICLGDSATTEQNKPLLVSNNGSKWLRIESAGSGPLRVRSFPHTGESEFQVSGRCRVVFGNGDNMISAEADTAVIRGKGVNGGPGLGQPDWSAAKITLKGSVVLTTGGAKILSDSLRLDTSTLEFELNNSTAIELPH